MSDGVLSRLLYDPRFEHDGCGIGFVAQTSGRASHEILELALHALCNHAHRGAVAADAKTGDGAGVLTQLPYDFFAAELVRAQIVASAPERGDLAVGMVFLPQADEQARARAQCILEDSLHATGLELLGWRKTPVDESELGRRAFELRPNIQQIFVARTPVVAAGDAFERALYLARRRAEKQVRAAGIEHFYIPSLSARTVVYKGLFVAPQLARFYADLREPEFKTALAVFHQRYSTNTFPTWERAQPFRLMCHNGEINTLQGNVNWMRAREADLVSPLWGDDIQDLIPVIDTSGSDSTMLDNALELLTRSGRDIRHSLMMLVPEAWENMNDVEEQRRAFYHYHSCLMEPWDGPAGLCFTDGIVAGAILDRNGLRPLRYVIMDDGLVIASSEAGAVEVDQRRVLRKGRLGPGEILAVDTATHQVLNDAEITHMFASAQPYYRWLAENLVRLDDITAMPPVSTNGYTRELPKDEVVVSEREPVVHLNGNLVRHQAAFGFTKEELVVILRPMVRDAKEPVGSMGDDTPPAVLSQVARPLFHYFKQRFAEVTNPPIDPLREEFVMSLSMRLGARPSVLQEGPESARLLELKGPILTSRHMAALRSLRQAEFRTATLASVWPAHDGPEALRPAVERLCQEAGQAVRNGARILILSDAMVDADHALIPSLLAVGSVHHHLIRQGLRMRCSLIVESGEPREVHHFACLIGYGANAVHPYLALATVGQMVEEDRLRGEVLDVVQAEANFVKAIEHGLLKVMSKMGVSTIDSYCGAQIFEALGLGQELIDCCFTDTPSRLGGIGFTELAQDVLSWHRFAFGAAPDEEVKLDSYGFYKFKRGGEYHAFHPAVVHALHKAVNSPGALNGRFEEGYETYRQYAALVQSRPFTELRDLLDFSPREPIPVEEVEPVSNIVRRFSTAGMSHGALSSEAHELLAIAMNRLGGKSNCGEGGEDESRFGNERNSNIKQVASGRFGVTPSYLMAAEELQIKMAQGSKPGEGGQLPGHKVTEEIARLRHSTPGVALISPPPHHDIYSIEDLAQLIFDLKQVNPEADVSVKLVSEVGVGTIAAGVAKGHADVILISGHSGGTGASPLSSIKNAGIPWEIGLAETQQTLVLNGLRSRVRVRADGGFKTGRDVVIAALLGADEYSFGTAAVVAEGCLMARACHKNTCPVGIATQRADLRAKFPGKVENVISFFLYVAEEVRQILAQLGYRSLEEIIGRTELLRQVVAGADAHYLDLEPLLGQPAVQHPRRNVERRNQLPSESELGNCIADDALNALALNADASVNLRYRIANTDRAVGARLSGQIARRYGGRGLPDGKILIELEGSAGQSFGAFGVNGLHLYLIGEANDYVGKGLGGGEIVIHPPAEAQFEWHRNVIVGNTVLYGATAGELYAAGRAGERFAVRNSGAIAVVEGVGDHGCEYMTGGVVVVLGKTGRNFGAGMTGGQAFVYDEDGAFQQRYNPQLIAVRRLTGNGEEQQLLELIQRHYQRTGSPRARHLLDNWQMERERFWFVAPKETVAAIEAANEGGEDEEERVKVRRS